MSEPSRIPLYDETVPVACTITPGEVPERLELFERMRGAVRTVDRTRTGLLLHFPDVPAVRADLQTFVVDEKRCCQFWGFAIEDERDGVALRWDGPPGAGELLEQLGTFFTTDTPVDTLKGLL